MAHYDGSIKFDTSIDLKNFEKGIGNLKSIALKGAVAIGAGLTAASGYAVNLASNLTEVQNVVDVTFGHSAGVVNKWAKDAATSFGMAELDALKFNGTIGAMLKSMQLSGPAVLEMSTTLTGLTGDFASFYNLDHEAAFEKIRAGISGETEPLKQLGINMSVANMEAFALTQGITKSYNEMSQAEQVALRYNYLLKAGADAQGDFARTSDSFANQLRIAKLNVSDLAAEFGKTLLPLATEGVGSINDITEKLKIALGSDELKTAIESTGGLIIELFDATLELGAIALPPLIQVMGFLGEHLKEITIITAGSVAAFKGYAICKQITAWFASATPILNGYTVAVAANSAAEARGISISTLLASTLKAKELLIGVLTGKVSLHTAATVMCEKAQSLLNNTLLKNPAGLVVAGITLLTAAIVAYNAATVSTSEAIKDVRKAHDEAIKSIDETASSEMAATKTAETLKNKLYDLEKQLHSGALTETEAAEVKKQHASVASQLNDIIPGIISNIGNETNGYITQKGAVDSLTNSFINMAKAKAMANAYQAKIDAVAESLVSLDAELEKYESGEKNKFNRTVTASWGGKFVYDAEYNALLDERAAYNAEMEGYIDKLAQYQVETDDKTTNEIANNVATRTGAVSSGSSKQTDIYKSQVENELRLLEHLHKTGQKTDAEYYDELKKIRDKYFKEGSDDWYKYTEELYEYQQELIDKELKLLEHMHKTGQKTDAEYYTELEKFRNNYCEKGSDDWFKYTEEIYDYQQKLIENEKAIAKNLYDEISEYAISKFEDIEKKQEEYKNKLLLFGNLFQKNTVVFGDETMEYYSLADIDKDIKAISEYNDLMVQFKKKISDFGISDNAASSFLNELNNLSVEEGTQGLKALTSASDDQLAEYMKAYETKLSYSEGAGAEYYFEDTANAVQQLYQNMEDKLKEAGYDIPEGFIASGTLSAKNFGEAFIAEIDTQLAAISAKIDATMQKIVKLNNLSVRGFGSNTSVTNNYSDNRTATYNITGNSAREVIEETKARETYENHTSKWR